MVISPYLVRLAVLAAGACGYYVVVVSTPEPKERLRNLVIVVIFTILMCFFGADLLALLLNSLDVQY